MPRANRYMLPGYIYHLTHRCVNKQHLLRYQKDRNAYRKWLREGVRRHGVVLYGYCVTCNHVHVIARVDSTEDVAVGSRDFVEDLMGRYRRRLSIETELQEGGAEGEIWTLRESKPPYSLF
jgi:putative transposase